MADSLRGSRIRWVQLALLACLAFGVYANTLANGFVNDDEHQVLLNPWIRDASFVPEILTGSVWGFVPGPARTDYYRPMMHLVYLANCLLFGLDAAAFHRTNALLHVLNSLLVFLLARRLFCATAAPGPPSHPSGALAELCSGPFVAAALFAVHPIHTEAVTWVASVPELTYSLFCLAALFVHLGPRGERSNPASLGLFALALLCKETAITFPGLLVAWELSRPQEERRDRRAMTRLLAPYLFVTAIYLFVRHQVLAGRALSSGSNWSLELPSLVAAGVRLFGDYLSKLLVPAGLSFWHPFPPPESLLSPNGALALAAIAAFAVGIVAAWRRRGLELFALLVIVVPLVPAFYIRGLPMKVFAERYLYLPSVGICFLAGLVVVRAGWSSRRRFLAGAVFVTICTLFSAATIARNRVWRDSFTLWTDMAAKAKDVPVPPPALAKTLLEGGRPAEAIALLRILAQVEPENAAHHSALGAALLVAGQVEEGTSHLRRALELEPRSLETLTDLAVAERKQGRTAEAISLYRQALEIDPVYAEAHFNLGGLLSGLGRGAEALEQYRAAVAARPESAYYHAVLGIECAEQKRFEEAIAQFEEAIRLAPAEPAYRKDLERAQAMRAASAAR